MTILAAVLVASLLGSLHCAGMCGALVAFAVGTGEVSSRASRIVLHLAYHGGRLVTYSLIGAVCGLLGAAMDMGGSHIGLQRMAALLAGAMMIAVGLTALLRATGVRLPSIPVLSFIERGLIRGQRVAVGFRPLPRALTIGLLTGMLPCGWLYMFAIVAAGTGSVFWGAAVMIAFWIGTVPVLASLGVGVHLLAAKLGRKLPLATALVIVLLGLFTVAGRLTLDARAFDTQGLSPIENNTSEQIQTIEQSKPPCCQHHGD